MGKILCTNRIYGLDINVATDEEFIDKTIRDLTYPKNYGAFSTGGVKEIEMGTIIIAKAIEHFPGNSPEKYDAHVQTELELLEAADRLLN